jgi:hypothetical protein
MPDGPSIDRTREALSRLRDDEPADADADERVDTDRHREAAERVEDPADDEKR